MELISPIARTGDKSRLFIIPVSITTSRRPSVGGRGGATFGVSSSSSDKERSKLPDGFYATENETSRVSLEELLEKATRSCLHDKWGRDEKERRLELKVCLRGEDIREEDVSAIPRKEIRLLKNYLEIWCGLVWFNLV